MPMLRPTLAPLLSALLAGCAAQGGVVLYPDVDYDAPAALDIPPGHLPRPGECRIWYPGVPPGQQPPPGDCEDLSYRVPPGAVLVR